MVLMGRLKNTTISRMRNAGDRGGPQVPRSPARGGRPRAGPMPLAQMGKGMVMGRVPRSGSASSAPRRLAPLMPDRPDSTERNPGLQGYLFVKHTLIYLIGRKLGLGERLHG
jgi:hypothetical protein